MTHLASIIAKNPALRKSFEEYAPNKQAITAFVQGNIYFQIAILLEFLQYHHIHILQIPFGKGLWIVPALIDLNYVDPIKYTSIGFKPHTINDQEVYIFSDGVSSIANYTEQLGEQIATALMILNKMIDNKIQIDDDIPF